METTDAERTARLLRIAALSPEAHNAMRAAMDLVMSMFDPDSPDIGVIISIGPIEGGSPGRGEAKLMPIAMEYSEMVSMLMQTANTLYKSATADAPARGAPLRRVQQGAEEAARFAQRPNAHRAG